jgi:hypothetical protein
VTDQILDLLLDALAERQRARAAAQEPEPTLELDKLAQGSAVVPKATPVDDHTVFISANSVAAVGARADDETLPEATPRDAPRDSTPDIDFAAPPAEDVATEEQDDDSLNGSESTYLSDPVALLGLGPMLGRLALILALLIIVVNIPFNRFGVALARAMPDEASLIIRDGLVLKGSGDRIYVLENNQLRWISSLDAFHHYGYRWEQVREVEDSFLAGFEEGRPIHLLLKCPTSPHIYALEDGRKRWIKDIPTFEAEGYVWEDVTFVSCEALRNRPDGVPIPPDAGSPP